MEDLVFSENSSEEQPTGKRWDPLGAPNDQNEETYSIKSIDHDCCDRIHWYVYIYQSIFINQNVMVN